MNFKQFKDRLNLAMTNNEEVGIILKRQNIKSRDKELIEDIKIIKIIKLQQKQAITEVVDNLTTGTDAGKSVWMDLPTKATFLDSKDNIMMYRLWDPKEVKTDEWIQVLFGDLDILKSNIEQIKKLRF